MEVQSLPKLSSFQDQESFQQGPGCPKNGQEKDVFTPIRRKLVLEFTWFKYIKYIIIKYQIYFKYNV